MKQLCAPIALAASGDWAQYRSDVAHSGLNASENTIAPYNVDALGIDWTGPGIGSAYTSSPAVANGVIYIGGMDSKLHAYAVGCGTNGNSCASCDPDGDGRSNLQEYLAGTDPTNNASAFRITNIVRTNNDLRITWTMGSGKTNALQQTSGVGGSYSANNFADIFTVTNTVGTVTNYLDPNAATNFPSRYYRIRLVP